MRVLSVWFPYWHVVGHLKKPKYKYGQWAPFMDMRLFGELLRQAEDKGYALVR